jgi:hypothetical protein
VSTIDKELRMGAATSLMKLRTLAAPVMVFALTGLFVPEATTQGTAATRGSVPFLNSSPPSSSTPQTTEERKVLHKKCAEAGARLEHIAAAMVPGRRWTWQLDSERSREHLDELQRDLKAFREADVAFEESLSPGQRSKFNSHMTATRELFQHLERDARTDFAMLCSLVFLVSVGGGTWSLDRLFSRRPVTSDEVQSASQQKRP